MVSLSIAVRVQPEKQKPYFSIQNRGNLMQGIGYNKEELRSPKQRWESNAEMSQQQEAATIPSLGEQREFGNQGFQSSGAGPPVGLVGRGGATAMQDLQRNRRPLDSLCFFNLSPSTFHQQIQRGAGWQLVFQTTPCGLLLISSPKYGYPVPISDSRLRPVLSIRYA